MKPFVHLHVHTEFSLLDGAAKISKLFSVCKERNMPAIAITDHGNMYGAVKFIKAAKAYNEKEEKEYKEKLEKGEEAREPFKVKPIIGCEVYICDDYKNKSGKPDLAHLVLLAKNQEGYTNLVKLSSIGYVEGFYYKPRIDYKTLREHSSGLICLSACLAGHVQRALLLGDYDGARKRAEELKNIFGANDFYIELQNHDLEEQKKIISAQIELARELGIKTVVTNDAHYINKEDAEFQDVMLCIQTGKRIDDPDRMKFQTNEFYLKTYDELHEKFSFIPEALDITLEIAEKCNATILFNQPLSPGYKTGTKKSPIELLRELTFNGLKERYGKITKEIEDRANFELSVIEKLNYTEYFLIVWDFVHEAEKEGVPVGPGRGSAAGSIVSYATGITKVEPLQYGLYFERFLNPDRISPPDIDLDFCFERRGEVIDYVTKKYGIDKVCQIVTFGTLAAKAAVKDVARVLNMPYSEAEKLTKAFPPLRNGLERDPLRKIFGVKPEGVSPEVLAEYEKYVVPELKEQYENNPFVKRIVNIATRLEGMPRNTSMHAAGVVICREVISDYVPLCKNGDTITTQYDMKELEEIGILKMDFLGLRTLTDLSRAVKLIAETRGAKIDFYSPDFNYDDKEVYKVIASGNTDAIFQLESGGMKRFMRELKPDSMEDVIAGIALYRPGPMSIIPNFIAGKKNPAGITYLHPVLKPILENTYGCIVYQEQVMKIVQELAGYSLSQGDEVRKMMGKKLKDKLVKERRTFIHGRDDAKHPIPGAVKHSGISERAADELFTQMESFGEYAFNKSHSTVYAYIGYQTAFLKRYYEAEFIASVLNNRITNSDEIKKYVAHARLRDIQVLPPDINKSRAFFTIEKVGGKDAIRFGLAALKGVGIGVAEEVAAERTKNGAYESINNFIKRMAGNSGALNKRFLEAMIYSGAFDCFKARRSQMITVYENLVTRANAEIKSKQSGQFSFFDANDGSIGEIEAEPKLPDMPEYSRASLLKFERETTGTYLSGHPLDNYTDKFEAYNFRGDMLEELASGEDGEEYSEDGAAFNSSGLSNGMQVECGGIVAEFKKVLTKASSREMAFLQVEDLYGNFEVMLFPKVYEKMRGRIGTDTLLTIYGKLSIRDGESPIILADSIELWEESDSAAENGQLEALLPEDVGKQPKKLYLKYNMQNGVLHNQVLGVLRANYGDSEVVIKCAQSGEWFKADEHVEISTGLNAELSALIDEANIFVK